MKAINTSSTEKYASTNKQKTLHKNVQVRRIKSGAEGYQFRLIHILESSGFRVKRGGPQENAYITDLVN